MIATSASPSQHNAADPGAATSRRKPAETCA
jgi:hypothetical protein